MEKIKQYARLLYNLRAPVTLPGGMIMSARDCEGHMFLSVSCRAGDYGRTRIIYLERGWTREEFVDTVVEMVVYIGKKYAELKRIQKREVGNE